MRFGIRKVLFSKYVLIPAVALLLYTFVGFLIAPLIVRWYVPKYARETLQCQAGLEKIRINPFLLTFEAKGFSVNQADGSPLAAFDRFFIDYEMSGLLHWAAVFREISLEGPSLHVVFEPGGGLNLQKLFPGSPEPKMPAEPPKTESEPFPVVLENVAVHGGKIALVDNRPSEPADLSIETFDFELKDLSTLEGRDGRGSFTAATSDGTTIQWEGEIILAPLRATGKLALSGVRAATLWKFARDELNLEPPKGRLDITTSYRLDASTRPVQMMLEGLRAELSDLSLKLSEADKPFLDLAKVEMFAPRMDLAARTLQVEKILVEGGSVDVRIDESGRLDVQRILREAPKEKKKEEPPSPVGTADELGTEAAPPATESAPLPAPGAVPPAAEPVAAPAPGIAPPPAESGPAAASGDTPPAPSDPAFKVEVTGVEIKGIAVALDDLSRTSRLEAGFSIMDLGFKAAMEVGSKEKGNEAWLKEIRMDLKSVRFAGSRSPEPQFQAEKLTVEGGELDLGAHSITVSRIALGNGHADVSRNGEGKLDWVELFKPKAGAREASEPQPAAAAGSWKFLVKSFEIEGFRSKLSDLGPLPDKPLFNIESFNTRVTGIDGKSPMDFKVDFQVKEGGRVSASGKVDPSTPSVEAEVDVAGLVLTPLQPYLEPFITLVLRSAAVSTRGGLRYGVPGAGANVVYRGGFRLDKLSLTEPNTKVTYLGFDALQIPDLTLTMQPNKLEAPEAVVTRLVGELIIAEDRTVNLAKVFKDRHGAENPSSPPKPKAEAGEDAFPFRIGKVRARDGNILFADLSLKPKFQARIHDLKGTVGGLASGKDAEARIRMDGKVDQYGLAKIDGVMRLYDFKRSTDIDVVFRNVEMTSLSPYSGKFAGRRIKSGKLSTDLKYKIQNGKLVGDNKIIVDNLVLGEKVESPDATDLPLDLAVALMKDSKGRIDLGLPVSGDLDNPEFSIAPLLWKAFANLLTKIVTAPFRALGALFGGGEAEGLDSVGFEPGSGELLGPEKEKLKKLAEGLRKRPELKLEIQGRYSIEADTMEFKDLGVRRAVATRLGSVLDPEEDPGEIDPTDFKTRKILEDMFKERFGKKVLDELDEAIKKGSVKPRTAANIEENKAKQQQKKRGRLSSMVNSLKLYKLVPGGKSPEEAAAWAGELHVRLVESEPVSEEALLQLARDRALSIVLEMEGSAGIPADRMTIKDPEPISGDAEPSAKLSLAAL
jgi:hypothetical protein